MPPEFSKYFESPFAPVCGVAEIKVGFVDNAKVERVIFNGPATIAFWDDGKKTVVKCRECEELGCKFDGNDSLDVLTNAARGIQCSMKFDQEKAVMAAMLKRLYKNYQDVLREALGDGR